MFKRRSEKKRMIGKSKRKIAKSAQKMVFAALAMILVFQITRISPTNSFFTDSATVENNVFSAGFWIPDIVMRVDPDTPDGENGWYVKSPCVKFSTTFPDATIFVDFGNNDPQDGGDEYPGGCVNPPEGISSIYGIAVNNSNEDWKSDVVHGDFKVDSICPTVKINEPDDGDEVSGDVMIKATITDANPFEYKLKIKKGTDTIFENTKSSADSVIGETIYTWDSTKVEDGNFEIRLDAEDEAGNKACDDDSVNITVNNIPNIEKGDVIINEVMWMGSTESTADEWIELKNTTGKAIDIGQWTIKNARHSPGNDSIMIPAGRSISANGYFLLANYPKTSANTALNVNVDEVNSSLELLNANNANLILKDSLGNVIDEALAGSSWPAGCNNISSCPGFRQSMQRKNSPGTGLNLADWTTCSADVGNDGAYWKTADGSNFGTPGDGNM